MNKATVIGLLLCAAENCCRCKLAPRRELSSPKLLLDMLNSKTYDRLSPPNPGQVALVNVEIFVESISAFSSASMDFEMDFYFWMDWYDRRLAHNETEFLQTNDPEIFSKLWWPDIYIANAKEATYLFITVPNMNLRVFPDGKVWSSRRIRAKLMCNMVLKKFPSDSQVCSIKMLTYSSWISEVEVVWAKANDSVTLETAIELPDFKIMSVLMSYCNGEYTVGVYSCLMANLSLQRYAGYHMFQVFIPSSTVVAISWLSFWISPRAVPARVTLSITTFLALSTQANGILLSLPPVSYATAVNVWNTICTFFVFGSLLEFAVAYHFWEKEDAKARALQLTATTPRPRSNNNRNNSIRPNVENNYNNNIQTVSSHTLGGAAAAEEKAKELAQNAIQRWKVFNLREIKSSSFDKYSRVAFPLAFLICNVVFWSVYRPTL